MESELGKRGECPEAMGKEHEGCRGRRTREAWVSIGSPPMMWWGVCCRQATPFWKLDAKSASACCYILPGGVLWRGEQAGGALPSPRQRATA